MKILTIQDNGRQGLIDSSVLLSSNANFSYNEVTTAMILLIPVHQQMIVADELDLDGSIDLEGQLCLI